MSVVNRATRKWSRLLGDPSLSDGPAAPTPGSSFKPKQGTFLDLTPGNPEQAAQIYAGTFALMGETHTAMGGRPFAHPFPIATGAPTPSQEWLSALHSFSWLRDLAASDMALAKSNGAALILDWIDVFGAPSSSPCREAWTPNNAAKRLMTWLRHGPGLFNATQNSAGSASFQEQKAIWQRSLNRHARYLSANINLAEDAEGRAKIRIALAMLAFGLDHKAGSGTVDRAVRALEQELASQLEPDGGHVSRNPATLLRLLVDLLPLAHAFLDTNRKFPSGLRSNIQRMVEAIRFFRHQHGPLAQFNGTGTVSTAMVETIINFEGIIGHPVSALPQSGYDRLTMGKTVLLVDSGRTRSNGPAHPIMAGALSFEMSHDGHRFIMNCGWPGRHYAAYQDVACATAAHSTLTINDTSSSRRAKPNGGWAESFALPGRKPLPFIANVERARHDGDREMGLVARHDGYLEPFGFIHERSLQLVDGGAAINGVDTLVPSDRPSESVPETVQAAIRFHLAPEISATALSSGRSILLAAGTGTNAAIAWTFTCIDAPILLEESICFAGGPNENAPRKAMQIVVGADVNRGEKTEIRWILERAKKAGQPRKKIQQEGDLLSLLDDSPPTEGV